MRSGGGCGTIVRHGRAPLLHRLRRGQRADGRGPARAADRLRARSAGHRAEGVQRAARPARARGTLDPGELPAIDLEPIFRERPAIHRFPGAMATRVHALALTSPSATTATPRASGRTRRARRAEGEPPGAARLRRDEGQGDGAVLANRFGVELARPLVPGHPTLGRRGLARTRSRSTRPASAPTRHACGPPRQLRAEPHGITTGCSVTGLWSV